MLVWLRQFGPPAGFQAPWSLTALLLLGARLAAAPPPDAQPGAAVQSTSAAPAASSYVGSLSCAAAACHNRGAVQIPKGSEYTIWRYRDPHAAAYQALFSPRSQRMVALLGARADRRQNAHEHALCLQCHSDPPAEASTSPAADGTAMARDGIGCERCHGPARAWLADHYGPTWDQLSPAAKQARGFRNTKDLSARVRSCVPCHVGTADANVNHDLIAAGHPRLQFEFASFHAIYPKHWDPQADKQRTDDFEVRAWLIGQARTTQAALALLAARAQQAPGGRWPELAEYDCFACHHSLRPTSWRQQHPGGDPTALGGLPWGNWYDSLAPLARRGVIAGLPADLGLESIREQMQRPEPDPRAIIPLAAAASQRLDGLDRLAASPWNASRLHALFTELLDDRPVTITPSAGAPGSPDDPSFNWERAAQRYLALAAIVHTLNDRNEPVPSDVRQALSALATQLERAFPPANDGRYASPEWFSPAQTHQALEQLRGQVGAHEWRLSPR